MHRVIISADYNGSGLKHENLVSFVWNILKNGDEEMANKLHERKEKYKPFVWSVKHIGDSLTLIFSSIDENITEVFKAGAEKIKNANEIILQSDLAFKIIAVHSIADVKYIGDSISLLTLSPITLTTYHPERNKFFMIYDNDPEMWIDIAEKNLKNRVKAFWGVDTNVKIEVIDALQSENIQYNKGKIFSRRFLLKISGSRESIITALYGGIGQLTGSGFGMMTTV